LARVYNCSAT